MSMETRMAIEHSAPMSRCSESRESVRYETKVASHWGGKAWSEVAHTFIYEIAWVQERECWRSFLCSVGKLG